MRVMFPVMGQSPPPVETPNQIAPFSLAMGEALALRVYIDKSVLEVYANVSLTHSLRALCSLLQTAQCGPLTSFVGTPPLHTLYIYMLHIACRPLQGRQCVTSRMYPSDPVGSVGVGLLSQQVIAVVNDTYSIQKYN